MAVTMDMLAVIKLAKPPGPIPAGLKVTTFSDANTFAQGAPTPVLTVGDFIFWPMSYDDNRMSFGIVSYGPKNEVMGQLELQGARYVYKITLDGSGTSGKVTFWGQSDQNVSMSLDQIYDLLLKS